MLTFLILHIVAMLLWAASLLYLPALIVGGVTGKNAIEEPPDPMGSVSRYVFTRIATPAALLAIMAGTLVFVVSNTIDVWLIAKLTLVTGLVLVHTLVGLMVLRGEGRKGERNDKPLKRWCALLSLVSLLLMAAIVWLVLAKPPVETLL